MDSDNLLECVFYADHCRVGPDTAVCIDDSPEATKKRIQILKELPVFRSCPEQFFESLIQHTRLSIQTPLVLDAFYIVIRGKMIMMEGLWLCIPAPNPIPMDR